MIIKEFGKFVSYKAECIRDNSHDKFIAQFTVKKEYIVNNLLDLMTTNYEGDEEIIGDPDPHQKDIRCAVCGAKAVVYDSPV